MGSVSSISKIRFAETEERGTMIKIIAMIINDIKISVAYCRKAIISPICIVPASTWFVPIHIIATDNALNAKVMTGIGNPITRFKNRFNFVISSFTFLKRCSSYFSLSNARMTNIPSSCSRDTRFNWSTSSCDFLNFGIVKEKITIISVIKPATLHASKETREE